MADDRYMDVPPATEQSTVLRVFAEMLKAATGDGGRKRAAGLKPPWWRDPAHEPAIFSHLNKWKHGERVDHDSGMHPLVHLAWRALAIAYQETCGMRDPAQPERRATSRATFIVRPDGVAERLVAFLCLQCNERISGSANEFIGTTHGDRCHGPLVRVVA